MNSVCHHPNSLPIGRRCGLKVVIKRYVQSRRDAAKGSKPAKLLTEQDKLRREVAKLRAENTYLKNAELKSKGSA